MRIESNPAEKKIRQKFFIPKRKNSSHIQMEFAVIQQAIAKLGRNSLGFSRVLIAKYKARLTVGKIIKIPKGFHTKAQQASLINQKGR